MIQWFHRLHLWEWACIILSFHCCYASNISTGTKREKQHNQNGAQRVGTLMMVQTRAGQPVLCSCWQPATESHWTVSATATQTHSKVSENKLCRERRDATECQQTYNNRQLRTKRLKFTRTPWGVMHWEVTQDFYLQHSLVLSVASHSFSAVTLGLPECCFYYINVPKSWQSLIYELVSEYSELF